MSSSLPDPMECVAYWAPLSMNSPGKNTGVGYHSLLQGLFPTQGSNSSLPHCRQILYHLSHQGNPIDLNWLLKKISFTGFHPPSLPFQAFPQCPHFLQKSSSHSPLSCSKLVGPACASLFFPRTHLPWLCHAAFISQSLPRGHLYGETFPEISTWLYYSYLAAPLSSCAFIWLWVRLGCFAVSLWVSILYESRVVSMSVECLIIECPPYSPHTGPVTVLWTSSASSTQHCRAINL